MTLLAKLLYFFPTLHLLLMGWGVVHLIRHPDLGGVAVLLGVVYLFPLACYRLHEARYPLREGRYLLVGGDYVPWWGASRLQWSFCAFRVLEEALQLVPGLYSAWLRAWGSQIGSDVVWTPDLVVLDRGLLEIGDGVVFGYQVGMSGHIVSGKGSNLEVVVAKIRIGTRSVIGAGSKLMPGATLGERCIVGLDSRLGSFSRLGDGVRTGPMTWIDHKVALEDDTRLGPYEQRVRPEGDSPV